MRETGPCAICDAPAKRIADLAPGEPLYVCEQCLATCGLPPKAGIGVYERGANGLLAAVRVYDDVEAPVILPNWRPISRQNPRVTLVRHPF
jgi:hypothetical protein